MQVQRELAERRYHEQSGMAYISAIMNAEAYHGKLKSFEHYFPSAKKATSADVDKAQRIKLNMLKFAHAHNAQSKYKQKGAGRY